MWLQRQLCNDYDTRLPHSGPRLDPQIIWPNDFYPLGYQVVGSKTDPGLVIAVTKQIQKRNYEIQERWNGGRDSNSRGVRKPLRHNRCLFYKTILTPSDSITSIQLKIISSRFPSGQSQYCFWGIQKRKARGLERYEIESLSDRPAGSSGLLCDLMSF